MNRQTFHVTSRGQLESAFRYAAGLNFYPFVVEVRDVTRTDDQNKMLWPLLARFEDQATIRGQTFKDHQWKSIFLEALGHEQEMLPSLDGSRWFAAGLRSSKLGVRSFSDLLELIQAEAATRGVNLEKV